MVRVYLASRFTRIVEMRRVKTMMELNGIEVVSCWLEEDESKPQEPLWRDRPYLGASYASIDLMDIDIADAFILFTDDLPPSPGGKNVELGYAIARGKPCAIVGPRENIFHALQGIAHFSDMDEEVIVWVKSLPL